MLAGEAALLFGQSFLVGLSGAVTPGPLLAYDIRETARRGFWTGPWIATGHSALEAAVVALLAAGALAFLKSDTAFVAIALIGSAILLWMGWGMVRRPSSGAPASASGGSGEVERGAFGHPLFGGALVSLSNPFWSLWWATVGLTFITRPEYRALGALGVAAFYFGHILSDYAWYALVSAGVASGRRILTDTFYRRLVLVCGLFLWVMAAYFLTEAARKAV